MVFPKVNDHIPTIDSRRRVSDCAAVGMPQAMIAELLNISVATLQVHYPKELALSNPLMTEKIAKTCVQMALNGNEKMIALWLKTQGRKFGFEDKQTIEITHNTQELEDMQARIKQLEQQYDKDY